jgi:2-polyprenyl-3-methyl-5-hydroxy-6-metoxy-1,4-benzoquinol methylase
VNRRLTPLGLPVECFPEHTMINEPRTATHLAYYLQHGLNPVQYEMSDLTRHLQRRGSLYRVLGLPAKLFANSRILEVAPGSGQNSLYPASCAPKSLTLVEPNPTAIRDIERNYSTHAHLPRPTIVPSTLQDFQTEERFDVVICENWLGSSKEERALLKKLGTFVAPSGLLVVTTVSPVGVMWNVLRKALACRLVSSQESFAKRTAILCEAFGPHLETIPSMTRSVKDWVQDNVMNPAYFGIMLSIPMAVAELGTQFDILGSSPSFSADWRWFKELTGPARNFNGHFLEQYSRQLHNFLDYRVVLSDREPELNQKMEDQAEQLCRVVAEFEAGTMNGDPNISTESVIEEILRLHDTMEDLPENWRLALGEFCEVFAAKHVAPQDVVAMEYFSELFGRETIYLSLERVG